MRRSKHAGQALAPDIVSYNTVIQLLCNGGPGGFADAMFLTRELLGTDLMPTHASFGPLLSAAHKYGSHDQVLWIWRAIRFQGLELHASGDCKLAIVAAAASAGCCGAL